MSDSSDSSDSADSQENFETSSEEDISFYYKHLEKNMVKKKVAITNKIITALSEKRPKLYILGKKIGMNVFKPNGKLKECETLKIEIIKIVDYLYKIQVMENRGDMIDKKYKLFSGDFNKLSLEVFDIEPSKKSLEKTREKIIKEIKSLNV